MLRYVGRGDFFLMIPARDITDAEIKELEKDLGWKNLKKTLIDSGLYEVVPKTSSKSKKEVD